MSDDLRVSDPSAHVSLIGRLLISPPQLGDPNFERSVVLMLAHNADGALGLVLNQPTALACSEVVPSWGEAICAPTNVFRGGPVETQAIIALARTTRLGDDRPVWAWLFDEIGTVDLEMGMDAFDGVDQVRVFAGYAGWGALQLESELAGDGWYVVNAEPGDAFSVDPTNLWANVLRRQRAELAKVALFPPDPRLN